MNEQQKALARTTDSSFNQLLKYFTAAEIYAITPAEVEEIWGLIVIDEPKTGEAPLVKCPSCGKVSDGVEVRAYGMCYGCAQFEDDERQRANQSYL